MEGWQQVSLVETLKAVHMVGCPKGGGGSRRLQETERYFWSANWEKERKRVPGCCRQSCSS